MTMKPIDGMPHITISMNPGDPTPEQIKAMPSETAKYRHLVAKYCVGCGIDIASQGAVVVPWALSFDLPKEEFLRYSGGEPPKGPIHLRGDAFGVMPFDDDTFDFVYASHILEDACKGDRKRVFSEWARIVKPGGNLIVLVPEVERWKYAVEVLGQCPNCSHKSPEPSLGDLSDYATACDLDIIEERLTECYEYDYTILGVFRKP